LAKNSFRKLMLQLHLWMGIAAALFLLFAGVSGTLLVFENEIDAALNPKLARVAPAEKTLSLTDLKNAIERQYLGAHVLSFDLSDAADQSYGAYLQPASGELIQLAVDQHTGRVLGVWDDHRFARQLHFFHTHLLAGKFGSAIVGWSSVVLLLLSISGLILWWRSKVFRINFQSSGPKFQYDLHSTIGVISFAFLLAFAWTGVVVHWGDTARAWAGKMSQPPASFQDPAPELPKAGVALLEPSRLLSLAQAAEPGARVTRIDLPDDSSSAVHVTMKFPEDHTPAGRTQVTLDPTSGKVLALTSSRATPLAVLYVTRINREIHTGDIGGWPTRILAAIFSLSLPVLAFSGPLLWWQRKQRR